MSTSAQRKLGAELSTLQSKLGLIRNEVTRQNITDTDTLHDLLNTCQEMEILADHGLSVCETSKKGGEDV